MKQFIPLALMALSLAALPSVANAAPNFSGGWVLNAAKSNKDPYPLYWMTRASVSGFPNRGETAINVTQNNGTLQITDLTYNHPLRVYKLDGKPHTVMTDTGLEKDSITATAKPDSVVIATVGPFGGMPGNVTMTDTQTWTLSPDGKVLTITIDRRVPARNQTLKVVYDKR